MGSTTTTVPVTALSGAVATIAVFAASQLGVEMTAEVGAAIATVFAAIAGYFLPRTGGNA